MGAESRGHSVADLLDEVGRARPVAQELRDAALKRDKVYVLACYPDARPPGSPRRRYTRAEAERLIAHAEQILRFCEGLLPGV